jgi:hypothetical protein
MLRWPCTATQENHHFELIRRERTSNARGNDSLNTHFWILLGCFAPPIFLCLQFCMRTVYIRYRLPCFQRLRSVFRNSPCGRSLTIHINRRISLIPSVVMMHSSLTVIIYGEKQSAPNRRLRSIRRSILDHRKSRISDYISLLRVTTV